jgi:hypothetical protein
MSAQGGTIGRLGTAHLPIWPVATVLVAAIAGAIALSTLGQGVSRPVDQVTTDAVFEQVTFPRGLENAGAYPAEVPVAAPVGLENPAAWAGISQITEATATYPRGLENPSAYGISQITEATATYPRGLENPGAYASDGAFAPKAAPYEPIVVNGTVCGQCR